MTRVTVLISMITALMLFGGNVWADEQNRATPDDNIEIMIEQCSAGMFAQIDEDPGPPCGPGQPGHMKRQRKHIEQLRMLKMLELLDLDKSQEISFLTGYNDLRNRIDSIEDERMTLLKELSERLRAENGSDEAIRKLVSQIIEKRQQRNKAEAEYIENVSGLLTARQLGKLVMFNERFERELLERVRAFREGRMRHNGPQGP